MNNKRNTAIDIISAVFIIEIIIQHLLQNNNLYDESFLKEYVIRLLGAYMPWFYFKAGIMFKMPNNKIEAIKDRSIKLIWPFIVWSIIPAILILPLYAMNEGPILWAKICVASWVYATGPFNTPLWFLPSLLFVYILTYTRILRCNLFSILFLGTLSWIFSEIEPKLPLGINNLPLGCFFFVLGRYLKSSDVFEKIPFVFVLLVYLVLIIFAYSSVNFRLNKQLEGNYIYYLIEMMLLLLLLFKFTFVHVRIPVIGFIGKNSIMFYVAHAPVIVILKYLKEHHYLYCSDLSLCFVMLICILLLSCMLVVFKDKVSYLFFAPEKHFLK